MNFDTYAECVLRTMMLFSQNSNAHDDHPMFYFELPVVLNLTSGLAGGRAGQTALSIAQHMVGSRQMP